jgi:lipoprotein-releasing system ATP-binding protein
MSERIRAEGLTKAYGTGGVKLEVLKGIDLTIEPGEVVAIHGPSGAGKSTLLHILGTLDRPTSGTIRYGDLNVDGLGEKRLAGLRNERIGFIFQFYHLLPEFTAIENVILPAMVNGTKFAGADQRARRLLASVGLSDREKHKPDALSGGEQQRVAIARAFINDPEVIFADEPTGNLDERNSLDVFDLMKGLNEEYGTTFVIVTHESSLAKSAGRSLRMADGRIGES